VIPTQWIVLLADLDVPMTRWVYVGDVGWQMTGTYNYRRDGIAIVSPLQSIFLLDAPISVVDGDCQMTGSYHHRLVDVGILEQ
jgi:hypothetical protein